VTQEVFFSETVQEMVSGRNVHVAIGVRFEFASETIQCWMGRGTFTANDNTEWLGLGELASIDGVQTSAIVSIEPVTITLSGLDPVLMELTRQQATEIRGKRCGVYILCFDDNWKPLDDPYLVELYLMDKATFSVDGESRTMSITVTAEPLFYTKHVPLTSYMTDQDQQRKYPGDKVFERVALLAGRQTVIWSQ
jgi:hypothetical protein